MAERGWVIISCFNPKNICDKNQTMGPIFSFLKDKKQTKQNTPSFEILQNQFRFYKKETQLAKLAKFSGPVLLLKGTP